MAITRISATVVGANVVSADKLANGSITTRHIGNESVGLAQLSPAANAASIEVRLNANLDVVQDNVASSVALTPFVNVITTAGSNAVGIGADTASDANVLTVTLDGVFQDNTEFVLNHSDNTLKFKDASIPSGSVVTIFSLT